MSRMPNDLGRGPRPRDIVPASDIHAGDVIVAGGNAEYRVASVKRDGGQVQIQPVGHAVFWFDNDDRVERIA